MAAKFIQPWHQEIAMDPKKVQELIESKALEEWYSACEEKKSGRKEEPSTFNFLLNEKRRVRAFIQKLSSVERVVVYLRYWENLLITEISDILEISETKINAILEESVKKLRALYIMELSKVQAASSVCA